MIEDLVAVAADVDEGISEDGKIGERLLLMDQLGEPGDHPIVLRTPDRLEAQRLEGAADNVAEQSGLLGRVKASAVEDPDQPVQGVVPSRGMAGQCLHDVDEGRVDCGRVNLLPGTIRARYPHSPKWLTRAT